MKIYGAKETIRIEDKRIIISPPSDLNIIIYGFRYKHLFHKLTSKTIRRIFSTLKFVSLLDIYYIILDIY